MEHDEYLYVIYDYILLKCSMIILEFWLFRKQ